MRKQPPVWVLVGLVLLFQFSAAMPRSIVQPAVTQQLNSQNNQDAPSVKLLTETGMAGGQVRAERALNGLPLYFIENQGQVDELVSFYIQGSDKTIYFSPQGVTFALSAPLTPTLQSLTSGEERLGLPAPRVEALEKPSRQRWAVKLDFVGANPDVQPVGESPTQAVVSFFKGQLSQWQTGVPTYAQIRYPNLWPGIDLVYSGRANELKYEFVVQPGADPAQIQLAYRGASAVGLVEGGQLGVSTPLGGFRDAAPLAYQVRNGQSVPVEMAYTLASGESQGEQAFYRYGFGLGPYDPSLPLVLDPAVLVYAGFIGGSNYDKGNGIAVDAAGNIYVTGSTVSDQTSFPVVAGPDLTQNGLWDAFIAKVNPAGTALIYAGYIGGVNWDEGTGVAVDGAGNAYVTGYTASDQATFPVKGGPDLTYNGNSQNGIGDAFVAKVNATGTGLVYAGYIGGSKSDQGNDIAVDGNGNAYITGNTTSDQNSFPVTVGPYLSFNTGVYFNPPSDAFVAKVNASGTSLLYAGYIGGEEGDSGKGIAVDADGNAYITGGTASRFNFPMLVGPSLYNQGNGDAYVAKVNAAGTALVYSGFIGGNAADAGFDIALDADRNAYVTGFTHSSQASFPVVGGPDLTHNGNDDAFVAKVNANGSGLVYAGYIGGVDDDGGYSIAVDSAANAYVIGDTISDQSSFPVLGGPVLFYNNHQDAFVAMVNPAGTGLVYAGYVGGALEESGRGIAVDAAGNAYLTGETYSTETSFPVKGGPDATFNGGSDAFLAKVGSAIAAPIDLSVSRVEIIQGITMSDRFTLHIAHRPALLRVFVTLQGAASLAGVNARLTRYINDAAQDFLDAGPITVYDEINSSEGVLLHTLNFNLPAAWLFPGTAYGLQLDPGNVIAEADENNNRYPASGAQNFSFVNTPVINVVVVPVTYARPGATTTNPSLNDLTYLTWMPAQVYPVSQINYTVRSVPLNFTGDLRESNGWSQLLGDITTLHAYEDPNQSKVYYGLVDSVAADGCSGGCTGGTGWLNTSSTPLLKTAVGIAGFPNDPNQVSYTLAHEMGHVYGRKHAPCGFVVFDLDTNWPYGQGAPISQWGYNSVTGQLINPSTSDYMGYCNPKWTSDYTYHGIYNAFSWVEGWMPDLPIHLYLPSIVKGGKASSLATTASSQIYTLSGFLAPDGSLQVGPLFRGSGSPALSVKDSRYQVVLLDAAGRQLASRPLELTQVAFDKIDAGEMGSGFRVSLPLVEGLASLQIYKDGRLVFERRAAGKAPILGTLSGSDRLDTGTNLSWSLSKGAGNLTYRALFSADGGATWQVLAANTAQPGVALPAGILKDAPHPVLLVQVSDGVLTDERVYELAAPVPAPR